MDGAHSELGLASRAVPWHSAAPGQVGFGAARARSSAHQAAVWLAVKQAGCTPPPHKQSHHLPHPYLLQWSAFTTGQGGRGFPKGSQDSCNYFPNHSNCPDGALGRQRWRKKTIPALL